MRLKKNNNQIRYTPVYTDYYVIKCLEQYNIKDTFNNKVDRYTLFIKKMNVCNLYSL